MLSYGVIFCSDLDLKNLAWAISQKPSGVESLFSDGSLVGECKECRYAKLWCDL